MGGDNMQQTNRIRDAIVEWVQTHECDCSGPSKVRVGRQLYLSLLDESYQEMSDGERAYLKNLPPHVMTCITTIFGDIQIRTSDSCDEFEFEIVA